MGLGSGIVYFSANIVKTVKLQKDECFHMQNVGFKLL